jgi:hypothetical protein
MGQILANVASTFMHTNRRVLDNLKEHSEWLEQQLGQYNAISRDFKTKFGYETYETPILLGSSILVGYHSLYRHLSDKYRSCQNIPLWCQAPLMLKRSLSWLTTSR